MATPDFLDRLQGARLKTGANRPFPLDTPEQVYLVEQGYLDIFVAEVTQQTVTGRRRFVARINAGEMAFGSVPARVRQRSFGLLAVPSLSAVIITGQRAGIAADGVDVHALNWIDDWVFHLAAGLDQDLVQTVHPRLLEADPDVLCAAGAALSAQHNDVIWVKADQPLAVFGRDELTVTPGQPLLPLTERTWCVPVADAEVTGMYTPEALARGELWAGFDRFGALHLEYSALAAQAADIDLRRQRQRAHVAQRRAVAGAMQGFSQILGRGARAGHAQEQAQTALQTATKLVAEHIGATLAIPEHFEDSDPEKTVNNLARRNGIKTRELQLAPDWWRRDGPSFVGFKAADGAAPEPLAILAGARGRYRVTDPKTGANIPLTATGAAQISARGIMLYAPLPDHIDDNKTIIRYALQGRSEDVRTLLVVGLLGGLLALLTPILTGRLLADFIPRAETALWVASLGALALAAVGGALFSIVQALALLRLEGRVDERLQTAVWNRLVSLPPPFFRDYTAGDLADRANGISEARRLLAGAAAQTAFSGIFSVFSLALMFYYSWSLALVTCALLLALAGATWFFSMGQLRRYRTMFRFQGALDGFIFQMISGLAKLRVAHAENYALAHWARRYAEQQQENLAALHWGAGQQVVGSAFQPLALLLLLAFVHYQLLGAGAQPDFNLADFLSFNAAFGQLTGAVLGLTSAASALAGALPLLERVKPALTAEPELTTDGIDPGIIKGNLEFANVSFRYERDGPKVIDNLSFAINQGDYVAFVGPSGCGKSTLYRLLLGFEQADAGTVFLDGHNLSSLNLNEVRRNLGVVLQHGRIMAGSVFENIAGMSPLSPNDAWAALRAAALEDDVRAMPMDLRTILPEDGAGLSVGQKQRLLIARALARKPRILLFDEATSALDNRAQAIVQASLKQLNVTRIVIAHRLSSIRDVEKIYVLDSGRIVESGDYDQLMARDGVFAKLSRRQLVADTGPNS